jgi:hypothetical protein
MITYYYYNKSREVLDDSSVVVLLYVSMEAIVIATVLTNRLDTLGVLAVGKRMDHYLNARSVASSLIRGMDCEWFPIHVGSLKSSSAELAELFSWQSWTIIKKPASSSTGIGIKSIMVQEEYYTKDKV